MYSIRTDGLAAPSPPGLQPDRVSAWQAIGDLELVDRISADGATARITGPAVSSYSATMRGDIRAIGDRSAQRPRPEVVTGCALVRHAPELEQRFASTPPGVRDAVSRFPRLHPDRTSPTLRAGTLGDHGSHTAARPIHYHFRAASRFARPLACTHCPTGSRSIRRSGAATCRSATACRPASHAWWSHEASARPLSPCTRTLPGTERRKCLVGVGGGDATAGLVA